VPGNSGGFLGVDVFFVISGFLITSILLREAEEGRFSIIAFYSRRVRRIFPALFILLFAVSGAAFFFLSPMALRRFASTLLGTTFFVSNAAFFRQADYFDTSSLEKPLLHTWSLAVEEQFYLIWPILLWAALRLGGRRLLGIVIVGGVAASFGLAVLGSHLNAAATFFLPFTRAWELGLGAAVAMFPPIAGSKPVREAGGIAGLAMIVAAIISFDETTPMFVASGVAALGAAVLIALNRERTFAGRLLSIRLFVVIGLISYPLYLWHWPLFAFAHYYFAGPPPALVRGLLILSAVGFAFFSSLLVEQPLRRGTARPAFVASVVTMASLSVVALVFTTGLPRRSPPKVVELERAAARPGPFCMGCNIGPTGEPRIVLWGDSHAAAVSPAISDLAQIRRVPAVAFTRSACPPLIGATPAMSKDCHQFQERAFAKISQLPELRLIVLAARWSMSTETTRFGDEQGPRYFLRDARSGRSSVVDSRRAFLTALPRTISALRRIHPDATILLLGQSPEPGFDVSQCMIRSIMFGRSADRCRWLRQGSLERLQMSDAVIRSLAKWPGVQAIYLDERLCASGRCPTAHGELPLYSDIEHLSRDGAKILLSRPLSQLILYRPRNRIHHM
jgi:peptidoglycan/LPS O-acetylase OafA/YrhL